MTKFAIYNYNFARIIEPNEQLQLEFPDWQKVDVEQSFQDRQKLLNEYLQADYVHPSQFVNPKHKEYWHRQIVKPEDDVYVMRVANVTKVTITDENLKDNEYSDYRNCLVIIDNRPGIQRIAIERKTKAFSDTKTVAKILEASFNMILRRRLLKVYLTAVYGSNVFWTTVNNYPNGFKKVRFYFPHLNLERLTKVMDKYLTRARSEWDSDLEFTFGANEGGVVKIDPNSPIQRALVEGASGAGIWIELFPKDDKRKVVYCGKNQFVIQEMDGETFKRLVSDEAVLPGVGSRAFDEIKLFMKNMPDVYTTDNNTLS